MSDKKISELIGATVPLTGSEVLPLVQSGQTKKVSVSDLTISRDVTVKNLYATENLGVNTTTPATINGFTYPWHAMQVYSASDVVQILNGGSGAARFLLTGNGIANQRTWGIQQFGGELTIAKYADDQSSTTSLTFKQNGDVNANAGNFIFTTAGKGITLKSPNGLITKTLTIDNAGLIALI